MHPTLPLLLSSSDDMLIKLWDWDKVRPGAGLQWCLEQPSLASLASAGRFSQLAADVRVHASQWQLCVAHAGLELHTDL